MDAVEKFRQALLPFRKYANRIFLVGIVAWTISLIISFNSDTINWATKILILAYLLLAWMMIHITGNREKQE